MPFTVICGPSSVISEECVWLVEGTREICVSYRYTPRNGQLVYAASVFRKETCDYVLTDEDISNHEFTTTRRYTIRPVFVNVDENLEYNDIYKTIRWQMCHGAGCKGLRRPVMRSDLFSSDSESDAGNSVCSILSEDADYEITPQNLEFVQNNQTHTRCYVLTDRDEHINGVFGVQRHIYLAFRGCSMSGDLIFGACIHRATIHDAPPDPAQVARHYNTATARLDKAPVHMNVNSEFRYQLTNLLFDSEFSHCEDIVCQIVDKIFDRKGGRLQIRKFKN